MVSAERVGHFVEVMQSQFAKPSPTVPGYPTSPVETKVERALKPEPQKMPAGLSPEDQGQWLASRDAESKAAKDAAAGAFTWEKGTAPTEVKKEAEPVGRHPVVPCEAFRKAAVTILEGQYVKLHAERGAAKQKLDSLMSLGPDVVKAANLDVDGQKLPAQLIYETRIATVDKQLPGLAMAITELKSMDCSGALLNAAKKTEEEMKRMGVRLSEVKL